MTSLLWEHSDGLRDQLAWGGMAALVVTAVRLAMPLPLQWAILPWLADTTTAASDTALIGAVSFACLMVVLGAADHFERVYFARFAIGAVRNMRKAATRNLLKGKERRRGEAVARLIGDTARVKQGLKGFLVHVAVKGLLLLGTALAIFLLVDVVLGSMFLAMVLLVVVVTYSGAQAVYRSSSRQRSKEGKLAEGVLTLIKLSKDSAKTDRTAAKEIARKLNKKSSKSEARTTILVGRLTWFAHSAFGVFVLCSLLYGSSAINGGTLSPNALLLFVLYVVGARASLVQVARQGARTGKILAGLERLEPLVKREPVLPACATDAPTRTLPLRS